MAGAEQGRGQAGMVVANGRGDRLARRHLVGLLADAAAVERTLVRRCAVLARVLCAGFCPGAALVAPAPAEGQADPDERLGDPATGFWRGAPPCGGLLLLRVGRADRGAAPAGRGVRDPGRWDPAAVGV